MKVVVRTTDVAGSNGRASVLDVLKPAWSGLNCISEVTEAGVTNYLKGEVKDFPESAIKGAIILGWGDLKPSSADISGEMRSMRSFAKKLAGFEVGDVIEFRQGKKGGFYFDLPEKEVASLAVGDVVAFNERVSPKYMMNVRAVVEEVKDGNVIIALDEGDLGRLERSGHKRAAKSNCPKALLDIVKAAKEIDVEVVA